VWVEIASLGPDGWDVRCRERESGDVDPCDAIGVFDWQNLHELAGGSDSLEELDLNAAANAAGSGATLRTAAGASYAAAIVRDSSRIAATTSRAASPPALNFAGMSSGSSTKIARRNPSRSITRSNHGPRCGLSWKYRSA